MIQIYKEINRISLELEALTKIDKIKDYRIYLKANNTISVYIIAENGLCDILRDKFDNPNIEFEFFTEENPDELLKELYFRNKRKVNIIDSHKRLTNLLNEDVQAEVSSSINYCKTPVITFYSYKGGVGRSTTLAACASYLAIHYSKKVVVIDCDFEAPGFTNFFLNDPGVPLHNNGVIEYFLDKEYLDDQINIRNYLWEASKDFSGKGEIYVMPSGNLNDADTSENNINDRLHYLQGLARIDFSENPFIINRFKDLIVSINNELNPDVILLDSRTGFNDVFGVTAFQLSNLVIGFFGNNVQTIPGIHFFVDSIVKRNNLIGIIVNSIIPASNKRSWFQSFKEDIDSYINSITIDENLNLETGNDQRIINIDPIDIDMFPITRNEILEILGMKKEDKLNFIDFIESRSFLDYENLFQKINSILEDWDTKRERNSFDLEEITTVSKEEVLSTEDLNIHESIYEENEMVEDPYFDNVSIDDNNIDREAENSPNDVYDIKMKVLKTLKDKMPELYAEQITDFDIEYNSGRYFYRKCMLDIFNLDKFIVLGNKGTGKTYIYRSLKNKNIVDELRKQANKESVDYKFIHLIDKENYFIDTTKFDGIDREKFSPEKFYERFWQVYIWNVLITELMELLEFVPSIKKFPITDKTETVLAFKDIIYDDLKMVEVENDLEKVDLFLKQEQSRQIIIIFDELDHVVKPHKWSERVAPLINLCKRFTYARIFPKLFLRSDLFEKISNVNNIQALNNHSINIEWNREELFAYFFKLILAHSKNDFFHLMKLYAYYPSKHINKIMHTIEKNQSQPPLDDYTLRHLSATFFGKYADVNNTPRFGESYDWFFKNLKNANDTISLRPFIDLLSEAVKWAIDEDKVQQPILPQYYFTHGLAREKAVERHFKDLAKEEGNGDLIHIFNYIRVEADPRYKVLELSQKDFYQLLDNIIEKDRSRLDNLTKESLIDLLSVNGIIKDRFVRIGNNNVQRKYQFALLYKYYLGLKNRVR